MLPDFVCAARKTALLNRSPIGEQGRGPARTAGLRRCRPGSRDLAERGSRPKTKSVTRAVAAPTMTDDDESMRANSRGALRCDRRRAAAPSTHRHVVPHARVSSLSAGEAGSRADGGCTQALLAEEFV